MQINIKYLYLASSRALALKRYYEQVMIFLTNVLTSEKMQYLNGLFNLLEFPGIFSDPLFPVPCSLFPFPETSLEFF